MRLLAKKNGDRIAVERRIAAPAEAVYALVSDLPSMGRWSPENTGGRWLGSAKHSGAHVGARFVGTNRNGAHLWATLCTVTEMDPGKRFAFEVAFGPFAVAQWTYDLVPVDGGTQVTETWLDRRLRLFALAAWPVTGLTPVGLEHREDTIRQSLDNLAAGVA